MNREIKFRAWDKLNEEMIYNPTPSDIYFSSQGSIQDMIRDFEKGCKCVLLQYTGLKDKNGKEIYEGDLITLYPLEEDLVFPVEWDSKEASFTIHVGWGPTEWGLYEVVGNIYENPELLKGKNHEKG